MERLIADARSWFRAAGNQRVVQRSIRVSLVVGTVLVAINHGDTLLESGINAQLVWKIPLTYLVPYSVSTYAAVDALLSS